jgi:hypothetical protein
MCFVFIWEQTAACATYIINRLVFTTEMKSVYSAVRTGPFFLKGIYWSDSFYIKQGVYNCSLYQLWKYIQFLLVLWATDWYYEDRSKDGGSSENILYKWKNTAAGGFRRQSRMCFVLNWTFVFKELRRIRSFSSCDMLVCKEWHTCTNSKIGSSTHDTVSAPVHLNLNCDY